MKRTSLVAATILLAFTGCSCGRGWSCWRPNLLGRLHDHIHRTNVGAPCASGGCASAPMAPPPVMADAGCENCGSGVQNYGYEGVPMSSSYGSEVIGGSYDGVVQGGVVQGTPQYAGEIVPTPRAQ